MKKILIIILLLPSLLLCSCNRELPSCSDILGALLSAEKNLPSGDIYLSTAQEGDEGYTQPSLLCALYGNGGTPPQSEGWIEFAIFLSNKAHPCEFAVFLCDSPQSVRDTSMMLCDRLDILKNAWSDSEYAIYVENASITVKDNFCILIISSDARTAEKSALSAIN